MAREEERNHTVQEFFVRDRSCRGVMNKGCKETGLSMSKSCSCKALEEPQKVVKTAVASSALGTLGVQQSESRKGQNCNSCQRDMCEWYRLGGCDGCIQKEQPNNQQWCFFSLKNATLSKLCKGERKFQKSTLHRGFRAKFHATALPTAKGETWSGQW